MPDCVFGRRPLPSTRRCTNRLQTDRFAYICRGVPRPSLCLDLSPIGNRIFPVALLAC